MAFESVDFTNEDGETKKLRIHNTVDSTIKHIEPPEGPPVYRKQLEAKLGDKVIDDIFVYRPDTEAVDYKSEIAKLKMGGLWTIGHHYTKQAILMAQEGYDFATFVPNFDYPIWRPIFDGGLRRSPYVWHAKNGRKVAEVVTQYTETGQVDISGHSYAGFTVTELIARYPELVRSVVLEDPAGLGMHGIRVKDLWNHELKPAMEIMNEDLAELPENTKQRSIHRLTGNIPHALRELTGLILPRSDMQRNLLKARKYGVPVGLLLLSRSAILSAERSRHVAEKKHLFDLIDEVDEYHIAPNIRPAAVVETEIEMFKRLNNL
jgi:pimeloyl-ACP methyl ester carboxylesterase